MRPVRWLSLALFVALLARASQADPPTCDPSVCSDPNYPVSSRNPAVNTLCGGTAYLMGVPYSLGSECRVVQTAFHLLGSPSGLAHNGGQGLAIRLLRPDGSQYDSGEIWLQQNSDATAIH